MTPRSPVLPRFIALMQTEVPLNFRTIAFCFFMGSVLSVPFGLLLVITARPFEPPEWIEPFYWSAVLTSFALLPLWSHFVLRGQPLLRRMGLTTFLLLLILWIVGSLFPAL